MISWNSWVSSCSNLVVFESGRSTRFVTPDGVQSGIAPRAPRCCRAASPRCGVAARATPPGGVGAWLLRLAQWIRCWEGPHPFQVGLPRCGRACTSPLKRSVSRTAVRPCHCGVRLVVAGPAFGGERGSLPRTECVAGTAPRGCRGLRGACGRHLAARARSEWRAALGGAAGAQPRPPPNAGPTTPRA